MITQNREIIEQIAIEEYGAFKINDDNFVFSTNTASTRCIRKCYKKSIFYNDLRLIRQIKEFNFPKSGQIVVNCCDILDDGSKMIEVVDALSEDSFTGENNLVIKGDLEHEEREELLNLMAYLHADKDLAFIFFIHYDYEMVEEMINES